MRIYPNEDIPLLPPKKPKYSTVVYIESSGIRVIRRKHIFFVYEDNEVEILPLAAAMLSSWGQTIITLNLDSTCVAAIEGLAVTVNLKLLSSLALMHPLSLEGSFPKPQSRQ